MVSLEAYCHRYRRPLPSFSALLQR